MRLVSAVARLIGALVGKSAASADMSVLTTGINQWSTLSGDKAWPERCDWPADTSVRATGGKRGTE